MSDSFQLKRQRASSEGDVLNDKSSGDETETQKLSEEHRKVSKSLHLTGAKVLQPVEVIADDQKYLTLPPKPKRKGKPSFKSVKSFMSKIKGPGGNAKVENKENAGNSGPKGGWTPVLQRKDSSSDKGKTDSTSRPLVARNELEGPSWGTRTPGTLGIHNHGNTCFMNAVLQCLSNTDWFSKYFITKQYKDDLKGKIFSKKFSGSKYEVTEQLGQLLESIWYSKYDSNISSIFKNVVGKTNNQYKGSEQHDAQEFLLWLLDRINDDLNVKKKDKIVKQAKSLPDEEAAEEALAINSGCLLHNMFQAVYRSSLKCPHCQKLSNTFETYLCLSLSLPYRTTRPVFVTIVYCDGSVRQEKVGLQLNIHDTIRELREEVGKFAETPHNRIVLCQITEDGIRSTFGDDQPITDIQENETVHAIELLPTPQSQPQGLRSNTHSQVNDEFEASFIQLIVLNVERKTNSRYSRFCYPVAMRVPREIDYKSLQKEILKSMGRAVKDGILMQKLDVLFHLRIVDSCPARSYLQEDPDIMPFYTQTIESAMSLYGEDFGPLHVKLVAEWDSVTKDKVICNHNDEVQEHSSVRKAKQYQHQPFRVSLQQCIQSFTKEETLGGSNAWSCPYCQQQEQGTTKSLGLWSLPDILVIHLKRFRQTGLRRTKLSTLVDFPVEGLDMSPYVIKRSEHQDHLTSDSEMTYDLYGVCNHYGNMLGGHYTAFCKNPLDQRWYEFDDSKVKQLSAAEVKTSSAYLLFYQRKGVGDAIKEDLASGSHWIYKHYPLSHPQRHVGHVEDPRELATESEQRRRPAERSPERETDFDQFVSRNVREESLIPISGSQSKNQHTLRPSGKLHGISDPHENRVDQVDGHVHHNASPARDPQRLSLYDRQSYPDGLKQYDEQQTARKTNTLKPRQDAKLTDRVRENGSKSEARYLNGSGLRVKLPETQAFIVKQNNTTGQVQVQRYDPSLYQDGAKHSSHKQSDVIPKDKPDKNQNCAISGNKEERVLNSGTQLTQGISKTNNPRLYADEVDSGQKQNYVNQHSFTSSNVVSSSRPQSVRKSVMSVPPQSMFSTPQLKRSAPPEISAPLVTRQLSHPTRPGFHSETGVPSSIEKPNYDVSSRETNGMSPTEVMPERSKIERSKIQENTRVLPKKSLSVYHKRSKSQPRSTEMEQNYYNDMKSSDMMEMETTTSSSRFDELLQQAVTQATEGAKKKKKKKKKDDVDTDSVLESLRKGEGLKKEEDETIKANMYDPSSGSKEKNVNRKQKTQNTSREKQLKGDDEVKDTVKKKTKKPKNVDTKDSESNNRPLSPEITSIRSEQEEKSYKRTRKKNELNEEKTAAKSSSEEHQVKEEKKKKKKKDPVVSESKEDVQETDRTETKIKSETSEEKSGEKEVKSAQKKKKKKNVDKTEEEKEESVSKTKITEEKDSAKESTPSKKTKGKKAKSKDKGKEFYLIIIAIGIYKYLAFRGRAAKPDIGPNFEHCTS
ncbi:hypothetical protein FSP39_024469 [Pinctada imbricata]|uniref:ubiquitinyl hydrolase 1 n=1 Tax=Pinctada imbricata TaxID=66713 RepID=A0AA88XXE9_PINIB|nr:hypothetical protein FSP39_024469 [Pinctada imbricata]